MQLLISCSDSAYRAYLYNFFGNLLCDSSIIVTEDLYLNAISLIDFKADYCANRNIWSLKDLISIPGNESYILFQELFSLLGINIFSSENGYIYQLPTGDEKLLKNACSMQDKIYLNTQLRTTDNYLHQILPYYSLSKEPIVDLKKMGYNAAGKNTQWAYDEVLKTIEITGIGSLASFELWDFLGITDFDTIIIGSGVDRIEKGAVSNTVKYVDLHAKDDNIIFESGFS